MSKGSETGLVQLPPLLTSGSGSSTELSSAGPGHIPARANHWAPGEPCWAIRCHLMATPHVKVARLCRLGIYFGKVIGGGGT